MFNMLTCFSKTDQRMSGWRSAAVGVVYQVNSQLSMQSVKLRTMSDKQTTYGRLEHRNQQITQAMEKETLSVHLDFTNRLR
jgi:hypothetical protein